ncbi:peptide chain release factor N(5)-glutamine methyltransferase [endosymbiont GvMRE of Glomus versiforme]|uniref:peptide chain release factor N(5)-glutamine methyltransferase n=1 Tax=endosymbiont GvMRE of Glomus versiforme TaxID=2039283 RepID=UPI000EE64BE6|nr:peptide chain release factor N(5)-glutamine methyltransferase [endosymbiont GvMRE of Glomus versiforme]RHZ35446.1 Release factor glutamine methyltransferase [endosymbiont GvMRE of Glomus versiforme]
MLIKNKKEYSYQDCWNYFFSRKEINHQEYSKYDLLSILQVSSNKFWLNFTEKSLSEKCYSKICKNINKYLDKSYPIPYLINKVFFYGFFFCVKKGVFIPQIDTEVLIEKTLEITNRCWKNRKKLRILDIGTGCGNIAISLAKNKPNWKFVASDINKKALKVAKDNAEAHRLKNIEFVVSNLFDNIKGKFNIIISNPPYVNKDEYKDISSYVKQQPKISVVARNNGYFFYRKIFDQAHLFLTKKFLLIVEIGYQQAEKIIKLVIKYFSQAKVSVYPDREGRLRVVAIYRL